MPVTRMLALLRGINVGGHRKVPMAALRALAAEVGLGNVASYIQSGNLVFESSLAAPRAAERLEDAIREHFGFPVDVVVRTRADWEKALARCPYPAAAEARPNHLLLALARGRPARGVLAALEPLCRGGEAVTLVGDVLWLDYVDGVGRSKLTPAALERAVGSPVTARNWKTAQQLQAMLQGGG